MEKPHPLGTEYLRVVSSDTKDENKVKVADVPIGVVLLNGSGERRRSERETFETRAYASLG